VVDVHLAHVPPHSIVLLTFFMAALVFKLFDSVSAWRRTVALQGGLRKAAFAAVRGLPGVSSLVAAEQGRVLRKLRSKESPEKAHGGSAASSPMPPAITALPPKGLPDDDVLDLALDMAQRDVAWTPGQSRMSGSVYMHDARHFALLNRVYARFAHSNPLHGDIFAASGRMEREVVAMTAGLLGGGSRGGSPSVCGCVTSGGTESILTAIRTTRDFFAAHKGISSPEMVVAVSAHAAVYKAANYFNIKLVLVPVDAALQMDVAATRRAVTPNTVLIYASAPGFPHGVVDNIPALAAIATSAGCGLHVDACLGGFLLPFAPKAGWRSCGQLPPWDFRVPGVTSMSVDTHKYGLAQKGSSVLLYANAELRRYQYTAVTEWSGGLYISPSTAGSRPGGLIAQTWASLMARLCIVFFCLSPVLRMLTWTLPRAQHMGEEGYVAAAKRVLSAADELAAGIARIPGLAVLGKHTMVVAWKSTDSGVNIYSVNDVLTASGGWHLNALQRPAALHFCVTPANAEAVPQLLGDLAQAVAKVRAEKGKGGKGGMAPVYGLAGSLPDRGAVGDILKLAQDVMLDG
jgi:sphinganine-1-phosphate aldolase